MTFKVDNIYLNTLRYLTSTLMKKNNDYLLSFIYLHYIAIKFLKLKKIKVEIETVNDSNFKSVVEKYYCNNKLYIDSTSCAIGRINSLVSSEATWINICSLKTYKKYKILVLPLENVKNKLFLSETTSFNIKNVLNDSSYFIMPAYENNFEWAEEVKVSIMSNDDCSDDLIDNLLKNYFSNPRYLRTNDVIKIKIKDYGEKYVFTLKNPQLTDVYFKVNSIKVNNKYTYKSCYVLCDKSTLIQETKVCGYLPESKKLPVVDDSITNVYEEFQRNRIYNFPLSVYRPFEELKASILPFMITDDWMGIKPIFLVKGSAGCGKYRLIKTLSQQMGFNFLNIDCNDIQTLSVSQTETRLRIGLNNAQNSAPCILKLSNIDVFGKNSEGKIDERITSNFTEQLNNVYKVKMKYPLIIIATSEDSEIPCDVNRNFIQTITIDYFTQDERTELIEWFLKSRNIKYDVDLTKISVMCSNYLMNDIESLTIYAATNGYKLISTEESSTIINENDFINAYDYMQSTFSQQIGAPKVPEVHWEDIGGLANLKDEIIRRIEIPLLHGVDIERSGILLYGPPGTGKTLLAKAVATECKLNFLSVKGPELLNMYVGQSEKNVRDVFELAQTASPCIIFFDELDALAPNRGRSGDSGGVMDRVVSQLLAEMDGLGSCSDTFIIGATNRPDLIDSALLRPGRFDKLLYVGIYSDYESQLSVLKAITRKFDMSNDINKDLDSLVKLLPSNLTGADLHSVCSNAWLNATRKVIKTYEKYLNNDEKISIDFKKPQGRVTVSLDDFVEAVKSLVPSVSEQELIRYEKLNRELTSKQFKS